MEVNKYKIRKGILLKTVIPICIIVGIILASIITDIVYGGSVLGGAIPIFIYCIWIFIIHGYVMCSSLLESDIPASNYMMGYITMSAVGAIVTLLISITSFIAIVGENLIRFYNVLAVILGIAQITFLIFFTINSKNAIDNKTDFELASHYIKKSEKNKCAYLIAVAVLIIATWLMRG